MTNVYIEPQPTGRPNGTPITHYTIEYAHGVRVDETNYSTQESAIKAANALGFDPLIARVRNTDKGNRDHWRAA